MELKGHLPSHAIRFLQMENPRQVFLPSVAAATAQRYSFVEQPAKAAEFNLETGVSFLMGGFRGRVIDKFQVFANGLLAEGHAPTEQIDLFLDDLVGYWRNEYGLNLMPQGPHPRSYGSRLEVKSSVSLSGAFGPIRILTQRFAEQLSAYGISVPDAQIIGFTIGADQSLATSAVKPARFVFERRSGRPYSENIYFAEAPLQSSEHMRLLEEMEALL